jgi:hypothetical protein
MSAEANAGRKFGPEPHHFDPYEGMSEDELDRHFAEVLGRRGPASVTISVRMPAELLERTKRLATKEGLGYQTLIKRLVDAGVTHMEYRDKPQDRRR